MSQETKKCSKCGEVKALDLFRKEKNRIRGECKECEKQRDRARGTYMSKRWAINNPNRVKEIAAAYRARLPIGVTSERMKKYRQDNPGKAKKDRAKYYAENSDKVKAKNKP